ncbi:Glutathione-dependent formaldehyde-activating enzyme [compost metagenome]
MRDGQVRANWSTQSSEPLSLQPVPQRARSVVRFVRLRSSQRASILQGSSHIEAYASSQKVVREFCVECGSTLFWSQSQGEFADWVSVALGTFDTPFIPHKQKHVHADAAVHWYMPVGG